MPTAPFEKLTNERYASLTTFRKDGRAVATPVWFATDNDRILVVTGAESGKVKRIRRNPHVTVAPCDRTGKVTGDAFDAAAHLLPDSAGKRVDILLNKKYGMAKRLISLLQAVVRVVQRKRKATNAYIEIRAA